MKIVKPHAEMLYPMYTYGILERIENAGRTAYQSFDRIAPGSAEDFVRMILRNGHESVLEHETISMRLVTDRGISHELVRHRLAAYTQESTRYCAYKDEIEVIEPGWTSIDEDSYITWIQTMEELETEYQILLHSVPPQFARAVLPTCLATELVMTANLREWRHILKLRLDPAAHPDMRRLMRLVLDEMKKYVPIVFDDIEVQE